MEMDAASRTGVGDIREIIDSVHYRAASARYKIYIIDEVHMLSTNAFNALLKTLEEPPEHVKFIFATTEIRKIPVTVLSRCQRFDLRRIEPEVMVGFLRGIAEKEGAAISDDALALVTRAAEGSVRDALSLMDQAIAHGAGETSADQVRAMLGVADRGRVLDLFEMIMRGDAGAALSELSAQYADGADPMAVLRDLAEVTHWVSVVKISPEAAEDPTVAPDERARGKSQAETLPMRGLTRMWQMLLKALEEVAAAPNAMMAAEMAIIRLTHVAELPSPDDLVRKLERSPPQAPGGAPMGAAGNGGPGLGASGGPTGGAPVAAGTPQMMAGSAPVAGAAPVALAAPDPDQALQRFARFEQVVELIRAKRDVKLLIEVENHLRLASYAPGRIEFELTSAGAADFPARLSRRLQDWTGVRWVVSVVSEGGADTIAEVKAAHADDLQAQARAHPMVAAALAAFPGAEIKEVRAETFEDAGNEDIVAIDPEDDDGWDPFEDD
jgi:DNA polymerase-3 subunit gamma/tau